MKDLKEYIFGSLNRIDCHVNLLGKNTLQKYPSFNKDSILFVNNDINNFDEKLSPYFEQMMSNEKYALSIFTNYVAVVGNNLNETIELNEKYKPRLLGEVKCFKRYNESKCNKGIFYENYDIAHCEELKNIPMFVHFDLVYDDTRFKEILEFNPKRPIVLCHCGMNNIDDKQYAFENALELQHKYPNLWIEISWAAWDYFGKDSQKLAQLNTDKLLLGTDFTVFDSVQKVKQRIDCLNYWTSKLNMKQNIERLVNSQYLMK